MKKNKKNKEKRFKSCTFNKFNEDPILSRQIFYNLKTIHNFYIGKKNGKLEPIMVLMEMVVQKENTII